MDFKAKIEELKTKAPRPQYRAAHAQWVRPAWMVRALVEDGRQVLPSVKFVVAELKLEPADLAIKSVRMAYYAHRKKDWPEELRPEGTPKTPPASSYAPAKKPATVKRPAVQELPPARPAPAQPQPNPEPAAVQPTLPPQPVQKSASVEDDWELDDVAGNPNPGGQPHRYKPLPPGTTVNPQGYAVDTSFTL